MPEQARELQNMWRTRAEEARIKLERMGQGVAGVSEYQQEVNRLQAALTEANRLRLLDSEKLAKQATPPASAAACAVRSLCACACLSPRRVRVPQSSPRACAGVLLESPRALPSMPVPLCACLCLPVWSRLRAVLRRAGVQVELRRAFQGETDQQYLCVCVCVCVCVCITGGQPAGALGLPVDVSRLSESLV